MPDDRMTLTERLRNPEWSQNIERRELLVDRTVQDMVEAADKLDASRGIIVELLDCYWGQGDGQEPPDFIKRAQALVERR